MAKNNLTIPTPRTGDIIAWSVAVILGVSTICYTFDKIQSNSLKRRAMEYEYEIKLKQKHSKKKPASK